MLQRGLLFASSCLVLAGVLAACPTPRYDTHCTPDDPDAASREDCPYTGEGRGPAVVEEACGRIAGSAPATCPPFNGPGGILDILTDPNRGNCSASACHGSPIAPAVGVYLPAGDPFAFYATLTTYAGVVGRPYVDPADPAASWMMCNLRGQHGGGFPMPPPGGLQSKITKGEGSVPPYTSQAVEADLARIEGWVLCGAPEPIDLGTGGGGGAGGAGGGGGAGGAGG